MTHPAVDAVLSMIQNNWQAGSYSDIPLERVDRDNSQLLDGGVRDHTADLQESNFVGATLASTEESPIGTEYDLDLETVVGVRIEGAHHSEWGYVDPDASLPPATAGDPVPWNRLVREIKQAIYADRTFPESTVPEVSYTHLEIANTAPQSDNYGDYYRTDFDVILSGFEELP